MEQDTSHSLVPAGFSLSDSELINLQNGGGEAAADHLSQGDLEALASIQEELDRMNTGGQNNFVEGIVDAHLSGSSQSEDLGMDMIGGESISQPDLLQSSSSGLVVSSMNKPTVRVVKRPGSTMGPMFSKVRIAESGPQLRIVSSQPVSGHQVKLINAGGNLKTIVPSETSGQSNTISIVNRDGSLTTLPVAQQGIKIGSSTQLLQGPNSTAVKISKQPQQIRILPNQPQTFKILNADGSFSDISSSIIRPKSDIKAIPSLESSPRKKLSSLSSVSLKSPQKVVIKPEAGQIIRTSDGRLISLQAPAKKVILPGSGALTSPAKVRGVQEEAGPVAPSLTGGQVFRLTPDSGLAPSDKVQLVRVVSSANRQTLTIKSGQTVMGNIRTLLPSSESSKGE